MTNALPLGLSPQTLPVEVVFGPPDTPTRCPVCGQRGATYTPDPQGLLYRHPGRAVGCRFPIRWAADDPILETT